MTVKTAQLERIHAHARAIWGPGDYNIAVNGRVAMLSREGEELVRAGSLYFDASALDALEGALKRRAANVS
jgi:hypothetical protein